MSWFFQGLTLWMQNQQQKLLYLKKAALENQNYKGLWHEFENLKSKTLTLFPFYGSGLPLWKCMLFTQKKGTSDTLKDKLSLFLFHPCYRKIAVRRKLTYQNVHCILILSE